MATLISFSSSPVVDCATVDIVSTRKRVVIDMNTVPGPGSFMPSTVDI